MLFLYLIPFKIPCKFSPDTTGELKPVYTMVRFRSTSLGLLHHNLTVKTPDLVRERKGTALTPSC